MVDMIVDNYGQDAIAAIAAAWRDGAGDDEALEAGTGVPVDELYDAYFASFGVGGPDRRRARRRSCPRTSTSRRSPSAAAGRRERDAAAPSPSPARAPIQTRRRCGVDPGVRRRGPLVGRDRWPSSPAARRGQGHEQPTEAAAGQPAVGGEHRRRPGGDRLRRVRAVERIARARPVRDVGAAGARRPGLEARGRAGGPAWRSWPRRRPRCSSSRPASTTSSSALAEVNRRLEDARLAAGLTPLQGPGRRDRDRRLQARDPRWREPGQLHRAGRRPARHRGRALGIRRRGDRDQRRAAWWRPRRSTGWAHRSSSTPRSCRRRSGSRRSAPTGCSSGSTTNSAFLRPRRSADRRLRARVREPGRGCRWSCRRSSATPDFAGPSRRRRCPDAEPALRRRPLRGGDADRAAGRGSAELPGATRSRSAGCRRTELSTLIETLTARQP